MNVCKRTLICVPLGSEDFPASCQAFSFALMFAFDFFENYIYQIGTAFPCSDALAKPALCQRGCIAHHTALGEAKNAHLTIQPKSITCASNPHTHN